MRVEDEEVEKRIGLVLEIIPPRVFVGTALKGGAKPSTRNKAEALSCSMPFQHRRSHKIHGCFDILWFLSGREFGRRSNGRGVPWYGTPTDGSLRFNLEIPTDGGDDDAKVVEEGFFTDGATKMQVVAQKDE